MNQNETVGADPSGLRAEALKAEGLSPFGLEPSRAKPSGRSLCVCPRAESRERRAFFCLLPFAFCLLIALILTVTSGMGSAEEIQFVDVAVKAGLTVKHVHGGQKPIDILETTCGGVGFLDYDNDGDLDIYMPNGNFVEPPPSGNPTNVLYRNNGDGTFTDVTSTAGVGDTKFGVGCAVGDYDNDGHVDIYVTNHGPNVLYRNNGDGTFTDMTEEAGVGDPRWSTSAAFADYDNDGDLDLYVANYVDYKRVGGLKWCYYNEVKSGCSPWHYDPQPNVLYRNNGDGTFTDVTAEAGVADPSGKGLGVVISDYDDDGDVDIYIANDAGVNVLYQNNGDGTFEDVTLFAGVGYSEDGEIQAGMGTDVGDYNNDGYMDIWVTNFSDETNTLYRNDGDGFFTVVTPTVGLGLPSFRYLSWGTNFFDYDNDGDLDIFTATGHTYDVAMLITGEDSFEQRNQLFRNNGDGAFTEVSLESGEGLLIEKSSRGVAFGDYDNDGDVDLLVVNINELPNLLRNEGGNRNNWLTIKTVGTTSNRDGIGARVKVVSGALSQIKEVKSGSSYCSASDLRLHFGLGSRTKVDLVEIRWPSGIVQTIKDVKPNQFLTIEEK